MAVVRFMFRGRGPEGSGRSAEIEALFREHNETLLRFLRARLSSEADAVEAAQEAYVRLLQLDTVEPTYLRAYFDFCSLIASPNHGTAAMAAFNAASPVA